MYRGGGDRPKVHKSELKMDREIPLSFQTTSLFDLANLAAPCLLKWFYEVRQIKLIIWFSVMDWQYTSSYVIFRCFHVSSLFSAAGPSDRYHCKFLTVFFALRVQSVLRYNCGGGGSKLSSSKYVERGFQQRQFSKIQTR